MNFKLIIGTSARVLLANPCCSILYKYVLNAVILTAQVLASLVDGSQERKQARTTFSLLHARIEGPFLREISGL
jgi:hypothetical protein